MSTLHPVFQAALAPFMPGYAQDVARGLTHPDSVAARRNRIDSSHAMKTAKSERFNSLLIELAHCVRTEDDVLQVLHAVSSGLNSPAFVSIDIRDLIEEIDLVADGIEYRDAS